MTGGRALGTAVVIGLVTGILTQLGQGLLPDGWRQAANSLSPWLLVAFLVSARIQDRPTAAVSGVLVLVGALAGYYLMTLLRFSIGGSTNSLIFWGLGSLVGGVVYGLAGRQWREPGRIGRAAAIGLMAAVPVAEGAYLVTILEDPAVGAAFIVVGAILPVLLGRSWRERLDGYLAMIPSLALGAVGFVVFLAIYGLLARIG